MAYFPEDYFRGETRDGFYIEPMMKCAWAAMIEVLDVVDEICARHGIRYYADYGTLLGAVRHQGFIPWDDDMDISMFREDYELFWRLRLLNSRTVGMYKVFMTTLFTISYMPL